MVRHETGLDCPICASDSTYVTPEDDTLHCEDCGHSMRELSHEKSKAADERIDLGDIASIGDNG